MTEAATRQRLTAILAADAAGYARLMGADDHATVAMLTEFRGVFREHIESNGGRVVDMAGDSVLAVFDSAIGAVKAAVAAQDELAKRNADLPEDRRMRFRVGVNLGDVIEQGDGSVYGDGVNVAARLQAMAEPGGVRISGSVFDSVGTKLGMLFDFLGEHEVKNIARPVRVYKARGIPAGDHEAQGEQLWTRPAVAVLPFVNMGADRDDEHFADGLTEDIITALAACRTFPVIARNSAFSYKGQAPDVRKVSRELNVRYVVEGSVRRAGNRVRVTAQLIDGGSGNHVWAHRFDRTLEDIFDLQDELTETIVATIEPELGKAERLRARAKRSDSLDAWELYQRGLTALYRRTRESHAEAKDLFHHAVALDPGFTAAYAALVDAYYYDVTMGLSDDVEACRTEALACARKALEADPHDPAALCAQGKARMVWRQHEAAIPELNAALQLNPSLAWAHYGLGAALTFSGRPADGIPHLEKAIRLSPHDTHMGSFMVRMSDTYLFLSEFDKADEWARAAIRQPNFQWSRHANLLVALGHLGRLDEARPVLSDLTAHRPDFSVAFVQKHHLISNPDCMALYLDGLRKAGVAEG
jgi:adenylate cyclase